MSVVAVDRRVAARKGFVIPVEVRGNRGFSIHSTRDISLGGLFFDRSIPHPVGALVELVFQLPGDNELIHCQGQVVNVPNVKTYGMGVRFQNLSPHAVSRIEEVLKDS